MTECHQKLHYCHHFPQICGHISKSHQGPMTRQQCLQSSNISHAIHSIPYIRAWSKPGALELRFFQTNFQPATHETAWLVPRNLSFSILWSNKSLLWSWSRTLEYLMGSRIHHSGFYFLQHFSRVSLADSEKWFPDLSSWSPSLVWRKKRTWRKGLRISVVGALPCL